MVHLAFQTYTRLKNRDGLRIIPKPFLGLILLGFVSSVQASPSLQVSSASVPSGGIGTIEVSINSEVVNLCGLMLTVNYEIRNPATLPDLNLDGLSKQDLAPVFKDSLYLSTAPVDPSSGIAYDSVRKIAIVHGEPLDGPTKVITLPFQAPCAPSGTYTITVFATANDTEGVKFPVDSASGTLTITGELPGDVNCNGKVDVSDAILALQGVAHIVTLMPDQTRRADLNNNGQLEVTDVVGILRLSVGLGG
jgi:hypothetical protein